IGFYSYSVREDRRCFDCAQHDMDKVKRIECGKTNDVSTALNMTWIGFYSYSVREDRRCFDCAIALTSAY
ncbi:MAG: hypothetical protein LBS99_00380, partial [Clostridiales bacterium]|nr:hypothetical protein [Clostridiales bacterium]